MILPVNYGYRKQTPNLTLFERSLIFSPYDGLPLSRVRSALHLRRFFGVWLGALEPHPHSKCKAKSLGQQRFFSSRDGRLKTLWTMQARTRDINMLKTRDGKC